MAEGPALEGIEIVNLVVTSRAADFGWLRQQDASKAATSDADSPLAALWRAATAGPSTRELVLEPATDEP
ncbi:hypothetical protein BH23GEM9_BH23GEM9_03320 [soil metagenome]